MLLLNLFIGSVTFLKQIWSNGFLLETVGGDRWRRPLVKKYNSACLSEKRVQSMKQTFSHHSF